jgi:hypothetical protein
MKRAVPIARVDSVAAAHLPPTSEIYAIKIGETRGLGSADTGTLERPSSQPALGNPSQAIQDSVTLSSEARALEQAATHPRFGALSVKAHLNPELAKQLAHDYGHMEYQPLLDYSALEGASTGPVRYTVTKEPVTPESEALFRQLAASLQAASLALYDDETAKGTAPADIFDKLIALGNAQSPEFRDMQNWDAKTV